MGGGIQFEGESKEVTWRGARGRGRGSGSYRGRGETGTKQSFYEPLASNLGSYFQGVHTLQTEEVKASSRQPPRSCSNEKKKIQKIQKIKIIIIAG